MNTRKVTNEDLMLAVNSIRESFERIEALLTTPKPQSTDQIAFSETAYDVIRIPGAEAPWVKEALKWEHKSEVYDEDELKAFLGFNPNGHDDDGLPWCAGFLKAVLKECGLDTPKLDNRAISFADYGVDCQKANGEIPDGAILVFDAKKDSKYKISHVGIKIGDKLFGGNQGDSAKYSNLQWYLDNAELIAARCPHHYQLT